MMRYDWVFKRASIFIIYGWLLFFALIPLILVLITSVLTSDPQTIILWKITFANYAQLFHPVFLRIVVHSIVLAFTVTLLCLLIAYPTAFILAQCHPHSRPLLLMMFMVPFWTSSLIRTYAIMTLIKTKGLLNHFLLTLGIIHHPLQLLYTNTAVLLGLVYNLLPYMILPLYSNIEKLDKNLLDAARDLGANRLTVFLEITIPLTIPGIVAGTTLVFLPAMTLFYIPDILGGAKSMLLGNLIENQFLTLNDWPGGCATSIVLTLLMLVLMYFYRKTNRSNQAKGLL
jgi:spermidine/putrescine transport system permease protein